MLLVSLPHRLSDNMPAQTPHAESWILKKLNKRIDGIRSLALSLSISLLCIIIIKRNWYVSNPHLTHDKWPLVHRASLVHSSCLCMSIGNFIVYFHSIFPQPKMILYPNAYWYLCFYDDDDHEHKENCCRLLHKYQIKIYINDFMYL